ncbi:cupin-like domain-containing protein [Spirosoma endbachense]|uniref:Cupin-like domain-containing protein n=1 Tax=Spirosoma endbachense TaxID=2666025 RepID=A0A6P1VTM9_9BACT|nr:cupin-like domain-containing protein [Spirosoma endbachense]QHV96581.1 cupin-like domain-containing protein [Spirosoma endbachense]
MDTNLTINKYKESQIKKIDRRSNISQKELIKEYIEPAIPVILTDATKDWEAMGKFTPQFFKDNYSHITKEIRGKTYSLPEYVDLMLASTPEKPAPYPFNFNLEHRAPELLDDLKPDILYSKSDRVKHPLLPKFMLKGTEVYEIFLGGNGGHFPFLHIDALFLHTQITQLHGSKEFFLFPPEQTPFMYPREENPKISQVNVFSPNFEKYPLFRQAQPIRVTIEEGETILFPTKWWHTTQIHEPCISLGRVHLNESNWNDFANDNFLSLKKYRPGMAIPALVYTKMLGQLINLQEKING